MTLINNIDIPDGLEDVLKFNYVIDKINRSRFDSDAPILFNLRNVSFISPYGLLGLLILGKHVYQLTGKRTTIVGSKVEFLQYLERMNFYEQGQDWFDAPSLESKYLRSDSTNRLLEIQKISINQGKEDVDDIVLAFRQRAKLILDDFGARMDTTRFIKVMSEICTNVYTHSESEGYVAIQRYKYQHTGFDVVKLAVVDLGIGIRNSLERRNKFKFADETDYLVKALEPGVSGLGDRGFGLHEVRSIVKASSGYLWISSGGGAILLSPDGQFKQYDNMPLLRGTRIAIILAFGKIDFVLDTDKAHSLL